MRMQTGTNDQVTGDGFRKDLLGSLFCELPKNRAPSNDKLKEILEEGLREQKIPADAGLENVRTVARTFRPSTV